MAVRLFSLADVPPDEAEEVRHLLTEAGIDYFETPGGNWGITPPAIWLKDGEQLAPAKRVLDDYQQERQVRVRAEYERLREEGRQRTVIDIIRENPLRFVIYLAAIAVILYFSTKPFLDFGR